MKTNGNGDAYGCDEVAVVMQVMRRRSLSPYQYPPSFPYTIYPLPYPLPLPVHYTKATQA
ncbi:hypothetical protein E2C01_094261 [Portunus trituberculatus]|uniref:Uncharacterized protein n=1 Tax=Portunus trituberculatus TaxID=210409 RepID=A0A5B7JWE3_PORTR|nr:hypothetical protein [Portunus trituberculatus]